MRVRCVRNNQVAFDLGAELRGLDRTQLEPYLEIQKEIDVVNSRGLILIQLRKLLGIKQNCGVTREQRGEDAGSLVALVEGSEGHRIERDRVVECVGLQMVVEDANLSIGVANGDVEGEMVGEGRVVVVELSEGGLGDMEFDEVGTNKEPEHESGDGESDDDGDEQIEKAGEETAATTAVVHVATAWSMVSVGLGGSIVGPV